MNETLDLTPINAHDVEAPKPGCRFLTKCEIPDLRGKRRVPGLFWWDAYENGWTPSARVADHGEYQVPITYVTEKPFGYYAPPEHPGLIHPAGFRGLTKLEYAVLETKTPPVAGPGEVVLFLRNGKFNQGTTSCPRWAYNDYAQDFVYANTSADPGPGCGTYGEVSVPEGWDVNKDVLVHRVPNDWVFPVPPAVKEASPATCCPPSIFCAGAEATEPGRTDAARIVALESEVRGLRAQVDGLSGVADEREARRAAAEAREDKLKGDIACIRGLLREFNHELGKNDVWSLSDFEGLLNDIGDQIKGTPQFDLRIVNKA